MAPYATRIKQIVTIPAQQNAALSQLTDLILLSYALRCCIHPGTT
jgi:hypothetical protein